MESSSNSSSFIYAAFIIILICIIGIASSVFDGHSGIVSHTGGGGFSSPSSVQHTELDWSKFYASQTQEAHDDYVKNNTYTLTQRSLAWCGEIECDTYPPDVPFGYNMLNYYSEIQAGQREAPLQFETASGIESAVSQQYRVVEKEEVGVPAIDDIGTENSHAESRHLEDVKDFYDCMKSGSFTAFQVDLNNFYPNKDEIGRALQVCVTKEKLGKVFVRAIRQLSSGKWVELTLYINESLHTIGEAILFYVDNNENAVNFFFLNQ